MDLDTILSALFFFISCRATMSACNKNRFGCNSSLSCATRIFTRCVFVLPTSKQRKKGERERNVSLTFSFNRFYFPRLIFRFFLNSSFNVFSHFTVFPYGFLVTQQKTLLCQRIKYSQDPY